MDAAPGDDDADSLRSSSRPKDTPSDMAAIVEHEPEPGAGEAADEGEGARDPRHAYELLDIRTPLEEFDAYVRARIDTLARLGDGDRAELAAQALELGRKALARVTGVTLPSEKAPR